MPIPHIVIFANFRPKINKLSMDRWDIRRLSKRGKTITVYKYNRKELKKMKKKTVSTVSNDGGSGYDRGYDSNE